jgi:hypothetical protein
MPLAGYDLDLGLTITRSRVRLDREFDGASRRHRGGFDRLRPCAGWGARALEAIDQRRACGHPLQGRRFEQQR